MVCANSRCSNGKEFGTPGNGQALLSTDKKGLQNQVARFFHAAPMADFPTEEHLGQRLSQ